MVKAGTSKAGTKGVARPERERQIVDIAGRVFAEHGYAGTSLTAVAEQAGISKPLIYNYFGSKEGLFAACLTCAGEVLVEVIERTARLGLVGQQRAVVTLDQFYAALEPRPWMWRVFRDPTMPATPEIAAQHDQYARRMHAVGVEGVRELLHLAGNDDPLDASAMTAVWVNVFDALVTWWIDHPGESRASMTARTIRLSGAVFGPMETAPPVGPAFD
ncbi:TetR/AcrR family transcriptional regulator [Streptacidiphilus melanogenes]|uniref:TetR/AcrR family transcriptional regulator n=1 Tax=Streptacidiphilus melanogenes TaxID=411235 RepID=UPI000694591B|nr:TetR/AcrR family transcriptional regulator [Streptacidiphilus melanogenes]